MNEGGRGRGGGRRSAGRQMWDLLRAFCGYGVLSNTVLLEASTICQLRCELCPQARGLMGPLGKGYLKFEDFKRLVDDNPWVENIGLSNYGELLLNPELDRIVRYAYEKRVRVHANNGTNLNSISDEMIECLVRYHFAGMSVSLDGACNETYRIYRRGGDFDTVIDNIRKINRCKKKYGSVEPQLSWQFVVFGHNEHEIPAAREMARELGMRFRPKINWSDSYAPIRDKEWVREQTGLSVDKNKRPDRIATYRHYCLQLWQTPQINFDGGLLGCCANRWGYLGNVFETGLRAALKGSRYRYVKKMLRGKRRMRDDMPCRECVIYRQITATKVRPFKAIDYPRFFLEGVKGVLADHFGTTRSRR